MPRNVQVRPLLASWHRGRLEFSPGKLQDRSRSINEQLPQQHTCCKLRMWCSCNSCCAWTPLFCGTCSGRAQVSLLGMRPCTLKLSAVQTTTLGPNPLPV